MQIINKTRALQNFDLGWPFLLKPAGLGFEPLLKCIILQMPGTFCQFICGATKAIANPLIGQGSKIAELRLPYTRKSSQVMQ
jgi:hypothetical protein